MKSQFGKKLNPSQVLKPANQNYQHCLHKHYQTVSCKKFQDLESQVLKNAIIVKTWGHGVAKM